MEATEPPDKEEQFQKRETNRNLAVRRSVGLKTVAPESWWRTTVPDSVTVTDGDEQHTTEMTPRAMGRALSEDKLGFSYVIRHFWTACRRIKSL